MICRTGVQAFHVTNLGACLACGKTYCVSCFWGCPGCGFGKGMDRREAVRHVYGGQATITEEDAG